MGERRLLWWIHLANGALVALLALTGALLYLRPFKGSFASLHFYVIDLHLVLSVVWVAGLAAFISPVARHLARLGQWPGKYLNLTLALLWALGWIASGLVAWARPWFPQSWRDLAMVAHDWLTWAGILYLGGHSLLRGLHLELPLPGWFLGRWPPPVQAAVKHGVTRRELVVGGVAAAMAVFAGWAGRWISGGVRTGVAAAAMPKGRRGYFRIYTVSDPIPRLQEETWRLQVDGLVSRATALGLADLRRLPLADQTRDFHCVSGWSVHGVRWTGVRLADLLAELQPLPEARYVTLHSGDGLYTDTLTLEQARDPSVLLAWGLDGRPLVASQGFPCRLVVPAMYGYKSVKWVVRMEFTADRTQGYWQAHGYPADAWVRT